jgi:hypothetical protein
VNLREKIPLDAMKKIEAASRNRRQGVEKMDK